MIDGFEKEAKLLQEKLDESRLDEASPEITKTIHDFAFRRSFAFQASRAFNITDAHGFVESWDNFGEKIALMHSELSEALEGYRKNIKSSEHIPEFTGVEEEFADVIIRIMSFAYANKLRVADAVIAKQDFNNSRPYKHGGKKF